MDKSHLACFAGGAALATAFWVLGKGKSTGGKEEKEDKKIDVDSEQYDFIKREQLARVIKYFGE